MLVLIMARCTCLQDVALECETFRETEPTPPQEILCNIPRCLNRKGHLPRYHPLSFLNAPSITDLAIIQLSHFQKITPSFTFCCGANQCSQIGGAVCSPGSPSSLSSPSRPTWTPTRGDRLDFGTEIDGFGQIENEKNRLVTEGDKMSDATFL